MVKGMYYSTVRKLQLSGGSQDLHYIYVFLMNPEFGLRCHLVPQMMGNISQMIKLSKGNFDTPTLTEEITRPYKSEFMQAMT